MSRREGEWFSEMANGYSKVSLMGNPGQTLAIWIYKNRLT